MRKRFMAILLLSSVLALSGCGSGSGKVPDQEKSATSSVQSAESEKNENPLLDGYYVGSLDNHVYVFKFREDGVLAFAEPDFRSKSAKAAYGTYDLDGKKVTISVAGSDITFAIIDSDKDGRSIQSGEIRFDYTPENKIESFTADALKGED
ncbi:MULTISPECIES: hypothetical protein [unclassified Bilifractor]|uniref:hypothetical protein n=2 Tax=Bilifractor TaxID=2815776 RepID=UPI003F903793